MVLLLYSFLAGFFEATFFFIIPDVLLSYITLLSFKGSLLCSLYSLLGALLGGALMYFLSQKRFEQMEDFLTQIPAISKPLLLDVKKRYEEKGPLSLLVASLRGIPYKIYAVYAAHLGYRFSRFMFLSIPSRLLRFLFSIFMTAFISETICSNLIFSQKVKVLTIFWIALYIAYFTLMHYKFSRKPQSV